MVAWPSGQSMHHRDGVVRRPWQAGLRHGSSGQGDSVHAATSLETSWVPLW